MPKLSDLFIDPDAERAGVVVPYKGVKWRIARQGNPAFNEAWVEELRPLIARFGRLADVPEAEAEAALARARSRTILVGWEGLLDDEGQPVPYSSAKALEILSSPRLGHVARFIEGQSAMDSAYRDAAVEVEAGN